MAQRITRRKRLYLDPLLQKSEKLKNRISNAPRGSPTFYTLIYSSPHVWNWSKFCSVCLSVRLKDFERDLKMYKMMQELVGPCQSLGKARPRSQNCDRRSNLKEKGKYMALKKLQLSGTDEQLMDFLGREIKARRLLTLMHFIPAKMSIVYTCCFLHLLSKAEIQPFSRCSPVFLLESPLMNWRRLSLLPKKNRPKAGCVFPAPVHAKKQQAGTAWGRCHPPMDNHRERDKNTVTRTMIYSSLHGFPLFSSTSCNWDYSSWT